MNSIDVFDAEEFYWHVKRLENEARVLRLKVQAFKAIEMLKKPIQEPSSK